MKLRLTRPIYDYDRDVVYPAGELEPEQESRVLELHRAMREELRMAQERLGDLRWMSGCVARSMETDVRRQISELEQHLFDIERGIAQCAKGSEHPETQKEYENGKATK